MAEKLETFKIIFLGDSGVGKSSIIMRYIHNTFSDNHISTVGVGFSYKEVTVKDGTKIQLKLIDTAGQEKYKSISKSYYKNAEGVLFIFAYDDKKSFDDIEDWLDSFKENSDKKEDIPIILIGNKYDVENKQIKDSSIEDLKNRIGITDFIKTSAKANIGIEDLFTELAEKVYNQNKKYIGKKKKQTKFTIEDTKRKKKEICYLTPADT